MLWFSGRAGTNAYGVSDRRERIAAIAKDYAAGPENTLIVSPDNRSRDRAAGRGGWPSLAFGYRQYVSLAG